MEIETEPKTESKYSHPYANVLEETLKKQKTMLGLLERKVKLIDEACEGYLKWAELLAAANTSGGAPLEPHKISELQYVDYQIQKIKTEGEIDVLKRVIAEKENYFKQYMAQFEKDIKEVELRYDKLLAVAKRSQNEKVVKLLSTVVWERIEGDDEAKIALYKQLKKYV